MGQIVTLTLFKFAGAADKLWAFSQMGLARPAFARLADQTFHKLMGTGAGAGFSTTPDFSTYTWLAVWKDREAADAAIHDSTIMRQYRNHAAEMITFYLEPTRTRGQWSGVEPFSIDAETTAKGPIVALTRATLAASKAATFWAKVPAISDAVEKEDHQNFMMGMGEVPWLHQVTFSIWTDEDAMQRFSLTSPTHGEAVRLAYTKGWFKEYLFARFNLLDAVGQWSRYDPALFEPVGIKEAA